MAKKLFKKKSFWAKLPTKAKVGVIALVIALVGAGAAYALSQSDASLQSKASLSCDASCQQACGSIADKEQSKSCRTSCVETCKNSRDKLPQICHQMDKYMGVVQRKNGLSKYQLGVVKRILTKKNEDVSAWGNKPTSDNFVNWYNFRCNPKPTCSPDWTKVGMSSTNRRTASPTAGITAEEAQRIMPNYYWPNGCKGMPATNGRMCTQATVPLTADEVKQYLEWVRAGKPAIIVCGSQTNCTPLPAECQGDYVACKLSPHVNWCPTPDPKPTTEPVMCAKDLRVCPDGTRVGRTGPNCQFVCPTSSPRPTCAPAPTCQPWQNLETMQQPAMGKANACPVYRCVDRPD